MTEIKLTELAAALGGQLQTDGDDVVVRGVNSLEQAGPDEIAFFSNVRYEKQVEGSKAAAVLVAKEYAGSGRSLIRCDDPYFAFRQVMVAFYGFRKHPFSGIDARANIDAAAKLGGNVGVAAFCTVCAGANIGEGTVLYPGVFVGPGVRLGNDCIIYPNVTIYDGTIIGDRVTIHAGSSIGQDGFGYATYKGRHEKIPQAGFVQIEDDVEIGANCAIDRATMGPTVIGAGTKFSNCVVIGHGTRLGQHCLVVAQTGFAGSTTVGKYCVFGGQSGIAGHLKIGDGVRIAGQTGVTGDVDSGSELWGTPAMPLAQARRAMTTLPQLPKMRTTLRQLQRQVQELQRRLGMMPEGGGAEES